MVARRAWPTTNGVRETSHPAEPHRFSHRLTLHASPSRQHAEQWVNVIGRSAATCVPQAAALPRQQKTPRRSGASLWWNLIQKICGHRLSPWVRRGSVLENGTGENRCAIGTCHSCNDEARCGFSDKHYFAPMLLRSISVQRSARIDFARRHFRGCQGNVKASGRALLSPCA